MKVVLTVLAAAFLSAFIPLINIETYIVLLAATDTGQQIWLAATAAVGQMVGKYIWYEASRNSTRWPWLQRRLARPKIQAGLEKWTARVHKQLRWIGLIMFVSAIVGLPPFMIMSIAAGRLRFPRVLFILTGLAGRFIRFVVAVGLVDWITDTIA